MDTHLPFLAALHELIQPSRYLEIGTDTGASLRLASCSSVAVDPRFRLDGDVLGAKPSLDLRQVTSDQFFEGHAQDCLGNGTDLAFIDGLHLFEYVLRDFLNTVPWCRPGGMILVHDVLPPAAWIGQRQRQGSMWAGDVWKLPYWLRDHMPDLTLTLIDVPSTGMLVVEGADRTANLPVPDQEMVARMVDQPTPEDVSARLRRDFPLQEPVSFLRDLTTRRSGVQTSTVDMAVLLERAGADDAALTEYRRAALEGDRVVDAWQGINRIHLASGRPAQACHALRVSYYLNPADTEIQLRLLAARRGNGGSAASSLADILRLATVAPSAENLLGLAFHASRHGQMDLAHRMLVQVPEQNPDPLTLQVFSALAVNLGCCDLAITALTDGLRRFPNSYQLRQCLDRVGTSLGSTNPGRGESADTGSH